MCSTSAQSITGKNKSLQTDDVSKDTMSIDNVEGDFRNKLLIARNIVSEGGGERARIHQTVHNHKLMVSKKLSLIYDDGAYYELLPLAGQDMAYGSIHRAGILSGTGNMKYC